MTHLKIFLFLKQIHGDTDTKEHKSEHVRNTLTLTKPTQTQINVFKKDKFPFSIFLYVLVLFAFLSASVFAVFAVFVSVFSYHVYLKYLGGKLLYHRTLVISSNDFFLPPLFHTREPEYATLGSLIRAAAIRAYI